ncbi:MAG: IgGFc-binding protein [Deltaproteobacteria bacterium]|nr:IgGFc-binding protein [Deltaproteobacteria bacterium]
MGWGSMVRVELRAWSLVGAAAVGCAGGEARTPTGSGTVNDDGTASSGSSTSIGVGTVAVPTDDSGSAGDGSSSSAGPGIFDVGRVLDVGPPSCVTCSSDMHRLLDCDGYPVQTCDDDEACDVTVGACAPACDAVAHAQSSVGCEYWATKMDHPASYDALGVCFAAFVANTWSAPVAIEVEFDGASLPVEAFARIPSGVGPGLTLSPYDPVAGLPPGEVAILFLSGPTGIEETGKVPCPITPAVTEEVMIAGTAVGRSFRIATDAPVVAYQMNPYGAGTGGAIAGASLLLPTSTWDTNYIAADAYLPDLSTEQPSMNLVATHDDTTITMLPVAAVQGGGGLPSGPAGVPLQFVLDRGQHAQFTQSAELTGSVISSDKPIGLMAGHNGLRVPTGVLFADHAEQMIPPVRALGHEYVGVMHQPRGTEPSVWRVVGAVDGTQLTWSDDVGGPASLGQGEIAEFTTPDAFVVSSQDAEHPFLLFSYMGGSAWDLITPGGFSGAGDAYFVIGVPPQQYLERYVFFMDPSYPENSLVLVRARDAEGWHDVELDCLGTVDGWEPVGDYEWTRVSMGTGDFQPVAGCAAGAHVIESEGPFGLWVWGWGTPATSVFTQNRSYAYPGGMNVRPINEVVLEPAG